MINTEKTDRIKSELTTLGVVPRYMYQFTINYLSEIMQDDEHIQSGVFGRRKVSKGLLGFEEGMLVATDRRILFIEHTPGFTTTDEITYGAVSGVNISTTLLHATVILYTRITNYKISYINLQSAEHFTEYIEKRIIKRDDKPTLLEHATQTQLTPEVKKFLTHHNICVISMQQRSGQLAGIVTYYIVKNDDIYFILKNVTSTSLRIQKIAFTVCDTTLALAAQLQGEAKEEGNIATKSEIMTIIKNSNRQQSRNISINNLDLNSINVNRFSPQQSDFFNYSDLTK